MFPSIVCVETGSSPSPASGSALARESRLAISFFDGRRRFSDFLRDFSIFEMNEECFISRLSFLELGNSEARLSFKLLVGLVFASAGSDLVLTAFLALELGRTGA